MEEKQIQALRVLLNEAYGACAWLEGIALSDRARAYKAKKLREALVIAEAALKGETMMNDDLGYLETIERQMAQAARKALEKHILRIYAAAAAKTAMEETKYVFRLDDFEIPVKDVPIDSRTTYNDEATLQKLLEMGPKYYNSGRLTSWRLAEGIGYLARKWFYKTDNREIKAHLVIPPELLFQAKAILESKFMPESTTPVINFVSQFIGGVWIDINIDTDTDAFPHWPWFVFANADLILGSQINLEGLVYFAGTSS